VQRPPSYSLQLSEVSITITVVITTVDATFARMKRSHYSYRGHRISETRPAKRRGAPFEERDLKRDPDFDLRRNDLARYMNRAGSPLHGIVTRAEGLGHDVELMVVVIGGLGQLRSDIEFLVLIESQLCCVRGLELFRE
jgi:hypothetical protein